MMEIREPRRGRKISTHWLDAAKLIRDNPGKFVMVGVYSAAVGSHIRNGWYPALIPDGVEDKRLYMTKNYVVQTEKVGENRYEVFIKYIGAAA
jgi:hypothetical protein